MKSFYTLIASFGAVQSAFATATVTDTTNTKILGSDKVTGLAFGAGNTSAAAGFNAIVVGLLSIVSIAAVLYIIYGGVQILSAGGDEEKVKTGRKTIVNVAIGITVMWISYWIVSLVIGALI